ncbi:unnamed protein product [Cylindrotheca closterium]|uniref:VWFD domain-containing protein n=1 Tax=Cylindrotheca closterium TaxID=2856 RepID=A0AAD2G586_9STRA|nr:unnamed protein product [Cylindrotheca closterium]
MMMMMMMKVVNLLPLVLVLVVVVVAAAAAADAATAPEAPADMTFFGEGACRAELDGYHDWAAAKDIYTVQACDLLCRTNDPNKGLRGFVLDAEFDHCICYFEDGLSPGEGGTCPPAYTRDLTPGNCKVTNNGKGPVDSYESHSEAYCYAYNAFPGSESNGDPHFRTWKNEHFEFHGQCDVVMTSVKNFVASANSNHETITLDLDIHLRTKMVRYWSYIEKAAIRIGNDILEVEGMPDFSLSYWINFEHKGELTNLAGFPVSINENNDKYTIHLDAIFPGQRIEIKTYKEFVGVKIIGATQASFGNAVGITGDYKTGHTYARDQSTILHDFNQLGQEWQVLPSDGRLFHAMAAPQFPEHCYLPEDPQGQRQRRLDESSITEDQAEVACSGLSDDFDRKGCVYDIVATQDLGMVGAY